MSNNPSPNMNINGASRRKSVLDYGGANSLSKFASSYTRAAQFLAIELEQDDLSPNTSPIGSPFLSAASIDDQIAPQSVPHYGAIPPHEHNHINTFHFPGAPIDEESHLYPVVSKDALITGGSTAPQTVFNAINTLAGIGILSLPLAFKLSGWVFTSIILLCCALTTQLTARLLGDILAIHTHLRSYGDIARFSFGNTIHLVVSVFFSLDLIGATVSLVILFGDSFNVLFPEIHKTQFKMVLCAILLLLSFLPLSVLSIFSILGIISTTSLVLLIIFCGFMTNVAPGSLLSPEYTNIWPKEPKYILLSLGILMAPWGGHPVFPELYRDMRHPQKYGSCISTTFSFVFILDFVMGAVGFLMFGIGVEDEVTKNMMTNSNYPKWVGPCICVLMGLVPISKAPLVSKPIITAFEQLLNIDSASSSCSFSKISIRVFSCVVFFIISTTFDSFGRVMAFLGSAICFTICITLPFLFYLQIFKDALSFEKKSLLILGVCIGCGCAILGSYAAIFLDL